MEEKEYAYAYEKIVEPAVKYCPFCEAEISEDTVVCPVCGKQIEMLNVLKEKEEKEPEPEIKKPESKGKKIDKWTAFLLCVFLGPFGGHKFYEGRWVQGIIYLLTAGLLGIAWITDIFIILFKPNPYFVKNKK